MSVTDMAKSNRLAWLDAAKGVGIVLVVYGHAYNGIVAAGLLPSSGLLNQIYYGIYTFHMPLFFLLAGITAERTFQAGVHSFLWTRFIALAAPYFLWSIIQGAIQFAVADQLNHGFTGDSLLSIAWRPIGHFWFLYALLICHVLAALARMKSHWLIILAIVGLALREFVTTPLLANVCYQFAFYATGIVLAEPLKRWQPKISTSGVGELSAVIVVFLGAAAINAWFNGFNYYALLAIPAAALGTLAVIWIAKLLQGPAAELASRLGRLSLSIYVMHVLAVAGCRIVLLKIGLFNNPYFLLFVCTMVGIIVPIIAHSILQRFGLLVAFGLAPPHRGGLPLASRKGGVTR